MAKCRGCGGDTRDVEADPGWMHFECEIKRLTGLLEELRSLETDYGKYHETLKRIALLPDDCAKNAPTIADKVMSEQWQNWRGD